jgi:hypothetical protein
MLLKRFFERACTRSSNNTHKREIIRQRKIYLSFFFINLETCLCTTAKRDSLYDDPAVSLTKNNERQSTDQYGFVRKGKF